jgi:orotate phosphoribosyltransferase
LTDFNQGDFNRFILDNDVYGFFSEPIKLKSGRMSNWYVNWRDVTKDAWSCDRLSDFILAFADAKGLTADTFYGVPESGTKMGVLCQHKNAKSSHDYSKGSHSLAMGRAKPKDHGHPKDKYFVGMPTGKVVIIEDVITTGISLITAIKSLQEAGVDIEAVIALTNRMEKTLDGDIVSEEIGKLGPKFYSMSTATELLPILFEKKAPGDKIRKAIEEEFADHGVERLTL